MVPLSEDLQTRKSQLDEFKSVTERVLNYMSDVINEEIDYLDYLICSSITAGTRKTVRPFNKNLFIREPKLFENEYREFERTIEKLINGERTFGKEKYMNIDRVVYTIQQAIGIGLDLVVEPNSSRKHVGNRFEELIRTFLKSLQIPIKKVVLSIPYDTDEGEKFYRCETDVIISPYKIVKSNSKNIDSNEIVVSLKTTTKDRMPKIFVDKLLMEKFLGHPIRILGISQNDIQRKEYKGEIKISYTFVSNLFMVYTKFLAELEGYYYLDLPKKALVKPFNNYISPFSKLIIEDIWNLLRP
jgi:hypothetical protein